MRPSDLRGRRVLITGASGFVGTWLTEYLVDAGADVTVVLAEFSPESPFIAGGLVHKGRNLLGSIEDFAFLERAIGSHMATRTLPQDWIHKTDLDALSQAAASSPRLRAYRDVQSPSGPLGTVIALQPGAYVRPHTHCPAGAEAFEELVVLRGAIGVVLFDATSTPRTVLRAGAAGCPGSVRFPAGSTHTAVALSPGTVVLETRDSGRPGPSKKHFAEHEDPDVHDAFFNGR